ncbi:MAG: hypothetical protein IT258_03270, partial [Saprospiraceae bacterium]|nr:hypothetical protein [Saprospiraceae bacterium]
MKALATLTFVLSLAFAKASSPFHIEEMPEWETERQAAQAISTVIIGPGLCNDVMLVDTTIDYDFVNGIWQFNTMNVFSYNAAGQLLEEYQYERNTQTGQWLNDKWYTYTYNAAGDLTSRYRYDWRPSLGIWENEYWYTNTYDALHRRTQSIRQDWVSGTWVNAVKYSYTYQSNTDLLTQRIEQNWNGAAWVNDFRYTYTINTQGLRTENAIYRWNITANAWALDNRYLYTYNANNCLNERTHQFWNGSSWLLDNKYVYTYNSQNYEIEWIKSIWSNNAWSLSARETATYFLQNAAPTSTTLSNSSIQSNAPMGSLVGNFITTDPDDNSFTYTLVAGTGGQDNAKFIIIGNQVLTNADLSNGTASQYFIRVRVSDGNGGVCEFTLVINVNYPTPISIQAAGPFCQNTGIQQLTASPVGGVWGGAANAQGQINPSLLTVGANTVTYTYTSPSGQTSSASSTVTILSVPTVSIAPIGAICQNAGLQTISASPVGGTWGGAANAQGQINPAQLGLGSHSATYSFTSSNGCSTTESISFNIVAPPTATISAIGPICQNAGIQQLTAIPAGGTWGGVANTLGQINPAALGQGSFQVSYTFTDGNNCSTVAQANITVLAAPLATLPAAGPYCLNEGVQTLVGLPAGGTWGGAASASGQLNPSVLGVGNHLVNYTVTGANGCTTTTNNNFEVLALPAATISGSGEICENGTDDVYMTINATGLGGWTVNYAINGAPQPPLSMTASPFSFDANEAGSYQITAITDQNGCSNTGSGTGTVNIVSAPTPLNIMEVCDATGTNFRVSFEIVGGDAGSYEVSGGDGTISSNGAYYFISDPIPTGSGYSFYLSDENDCSPSVVAANQVVCNCVTMPGIMSQTLVATCGNGPIVVPPLSGQILDPNDAVVYVLHTSPSNQLGNVLATSPIPSFSFQPNLQYGTTYYVSAVVGNATANGVDLNDPCMGVATGTPIVFNALPSATIQGSTSICEGETANLMLNLLGNGPFTVVYNDGLNNASLNGIYNGYQLSVSPSGGTTTYTLVSVATDFCSNTASSSATITLLPKATTYQTTAICEGESIILAGAPQTQPGIFTDVLTASNGCDSTVYTTLIVNQLDTTHIGGTSCVPAQTGTFIQHFPNQNNCDSVVIQTIVFAASDTTYTYLQSCDPNQTGVTSAQFINQFGCDSVAITSTTLVQTDTTYLFAQTCEPSEVGTINQLLSNQNGCDSLVITETSLYPLPSLSAGIQSDFNGFGISCAGASDGAATATVIASGTPPYAYTWSNGLQSANATGLEAGNYSVTLTDVNGCKATESVIVESPPLLELNELSVTDFECENPGNASFEVAASGGAGPYEFAINDGDLQANGQFSVSEAGAYKVEVKDGNGCETSLVVELKGAVPFTVELGPDHVIEAGETVEITVVIPEIPLAEIATLTWSPSEGLLGCVGCINQT